MTATSPSTTPWSAAVRRLAIPALLGAALLAVLASRTLAPQATRGTLGALTALLGGHGQAAPAGARGADDGASATAGAGASSAAAAGGAAGAGSPGESGAPAAMDAAAIGAAPGRVTAEGRLVTYPGAQAVIGADVAGTVVRLAVRENQPVRRGALVADLRADDARSELAAARAKQGEAEADLRFGAKDAERARFLADRGAGTERDAERAASNRDAAGARVATAQAEVRRLEAVLAKAHIVAPIDGTVIDRAVQPGEHVEAGAPLITVADLRRTRIEAEVDEFDAGHVALGAPVAVTVEGYEGRAWRGHVEEIPDAVVARKLRPQDPGRPADTRVLLVKIALDEPNPIKLGQRVEVAIAPPPPRRIAG